MYLGASNEAIRTERSLMVRVVGTLLCCIDDHCRTRPSGGSLHNEGQGCANIPRPKIDRGVWLELSSSRFAPHCGRCDRRLMVSSGTHSTRHICAVSAVRDGRLGRNRERVWLGPWLVDALERNTSHLSLVGPWHVHPDRGVWFRSVFQRASASRRASKGLHVDSPEEFAGPDRQL